MSNSIGPKHDVPRVLRYVCISILLFTCSMVFTQKPDTPIRNIVLVRGAWTDAVAASSPTAMAEPDEFTYLDPAQFHDLFAADLSAEQAPFMAQSRVFNLAETFQASLERLPGEASAVGCW